MINKIRSEYPYLSGNTTTRTIIDLAFLMPQDDVSALKILTALNLYYEKATFAKAEIRSLNKIERASGYENNNLRMLALRDIPPEIRNLLVIRANGVAIEIAETEETSSI